MSSSPDEGAPGTDSHASRSWARGGRSRLLAHGLHDSHCGGLCTGPGKGARPGQSIPELPTKNACLACHQLDPQLVGPAYLDVVAQYQDRQDRLDARDYCIVQRIWASSNGRWGGAVPMPAQPAPGPKPTLRPLPPGSPAVPGIEV